MMALRTIRADLHVHTVLSACAEVEMTPPGIVGRALELGLGLIAVTDHNASANALAVIAAAEGTGLRVWPGMELQTQEEIHLLCLFDGLEGCGRFQGEIDRRLPSLENREEIFGPQFVVDAAGGWVRTDKRLLAASATIGLEEAIERVHALGGLAIPAHVDRPSFSVIANLGMIPPGLGADALEVTRRFRPEAAPMERTGMAGWPLVCGGDAHRLAEMTDRTVLVVGEATVGEFREALRGEGGRSVGVEWEDE